MPLDMPGAKLNAGPTQLQLGGAAEAKFVICYQTIDITGIWTQQGWLYVAGIVDGYSRLVVGWAMSATRDETLVEQALHMALQQRHPDAGLLHHTDHTRVPPTGRCWQNAASPSA